MRRQQRLIAMFLLLVILLIAFSPLYAKNGGSVAWALFAAELWIIGVILSDRWLPIQWGDDDDDDNENDGGDSDNKEE